MDQHLVLVKTDKGREEIEKRIYGLDFRRRATLIVVDGHSTVTELIKKATYLGDVNGYLNSLFADGFIAPAPAAPAAPAARVPAPTRAVTPAPAPAPAAALAPAASPAPAVPAPILSPAGRLAAAKSVAYKLVYDALGPDGDLVSGKLEKAATEAEFLAQAEKCRGLIEGMRGARRAQAFWQAVTGALGAF